MAYNLLARRVDVRDCNAGRVIIPHVENQAAEGQRRCVQQELQIRRVAGAMYIEVRNDV